MEFKFISNYFMYLINKNTNRIEELRKVTFSELGFKERANLQEWLEEQPNALGEPLLIIQKEFSGFDDTNERLDLLAIDKEGNLVIIENKLDDTGKDVTWQAIKYASYCSTLKKAQIQQIYQQYLGKKGTAENAIDRLRDFFKDTEYSYDDLSVNNSQTQRIFLVAKNFKKEVTSTVIWLLNYKIQLKCFKATPFALDDQFFLNLEQIIPIKEAEEYIIKMADKVQDDLSTQEELKETHQLRLEFWAKLLSRIKGQTSIFQNTSPTKDHWLNSGGTSITGLSYSFVVTKSHSSIELAILKPDTQINKYIFDELRKFEDEINKNFGHQLSWERLDNRKMSRIAFALEGVNFFKKQDWEQISDFLIKNMINLEKAMRDPLKRVKLKLSEKEEQ